MADTMQLNSGEHALRDTDDDQLALDPELVAAISNCDFIDVNEEDAEYQRHLARPLKPTFTASVLEIPCSASPGASRANSSIASRTPEPVRDELHSEARDVRSRDGTYTADPDYNLDEFINSSAYEHSDTVKPEPSMPPPSLPLRNRFEPPANMKVEPLPYAQSPPPPHGAFLESPTEPRNELSRSLSKRGRQDTSTTLSGLTKKPSGKRHKQRKDGYPCDCKQCPEIFDRQCDMNKHYQRTHAPKETLRHSCWICQDHGKIKRFVYPKDLRRHFRQVHDDNIIAASVSTTTDNTSPASENKSLKNVGLWALIQTVVSFKKLRITATSPQPKMIMVSRDQRAFVDVEVPSSILTAEQLAARILQTLGVDDESLPIQAQTYRRRRHRRRQQQPGSVHLGEKLDAQKIFDLVAQKADTEGSLRLFVSVVGGGGGGGGNAS
ncbi:hypothetical protein BST61_g3120 [Cercospora zeina]